MPNPTEKQNSDTNHQEQDPATSSGESTEQPVGREATPGVVEVANLSGTNSSTDVESRSYRRDDNANAMGRARSSATRVPGNEYCDADDDVPTVPNIVNAGPGAPRVSQLVTLKDGGHTGNGGGYRIAITPHMIVIAMQSLMKKGCELTPQAIADFIRDRYPVCQSPRDFTHELVDKLQCAVATKIIQRSGDNYALPTRRRNRVHLLRNETKAFWQRYSRIVKSKKNNAKLPSGAHTKNYSDSKTRHPNRLRAQERRERSDSSSPDSSRESPNEGPRTKRRKSDSRSASSTSSTLSMSSEANNATETRKSARNNEDRILESSRRRGDPHSKQNNRPGATQSTRPARNGHQESNCNNKSKDNDTSTSRSKESSTNELKPSSSSDYTLRSHKSSSDSRQSETKVKHGIPHRRVSPHSKTIKYSDDTDKPSLPRKRRLSHSSSNSSPEDIKRQASSKEGSYSRPKRRTDEDFFDLSSSHRSVSSHSISSRDSDEEQMSGITSLGKSHRNTPINITVGTNRPTSSRRCRHQNTPCNKRVHSKCCSKTGNSAMSSSSETNTSAPPCKTKRTNPIFEKNIEARTSNRNHKNYSKNKTVSHSNYNYESAGKTSNDGYRVTRASYNRNQGQAQKRNSGNKKKNSRRNTNRRTNRKSIRTSARFKYRNRNTKQSNYKKKPSKSSNYKSKETKEDEKRQTRSRSPITIMKNPPEGQTSSKSSMIVKEGSPNSRNDATPKPSPERDSNIPFDLQESGTSRENKVPRHASQTPSHTPDKHSSPSSSRRTSRPRDRQRRRSDRSQSPRRDHRRQSSSRERSEHSGRGRKMSRDAPVKKTTKR